MVVFIYLFLVESREKMQNIRFEETAIGVGLIIILAIIRFGIETFENNRQHQKLQDTLLFLNQQQHILTETNENLLTEVHERRRMEEQLEYDANHDSLTGLPNRVLLLNRLRQALDSTQTQDEIQYSVLFLDLDHFKVVNDSMGYNPGDELLMMVGKRLSKCIRECDTVARLGGDEFVILLEFNGDEKSLQHITDRICHELTLPYPLENQLAFITASIGIVKNITGYGTPEEVLRDADITMYRAKELGKARSVMFEPDLRNKAIARMKLETDLRLALVRNEFELHYQPIIDLENKGLVGFEALIRWKHPERGLISPLEFIGVAEETGLIIPIGKWVLQEATSQLKYWQGRIQNSSDLFVNVNISGCQLAQPDFVELIQEVLSASTLQPDCLKLEITESILIENYTAANITFSKLEELGIQFEIDDFGTGYSSIGYLKHFPIHTVKIDKTFIHDISEDSRGSDLIQAMISMANNLGMETIAEGVETKDQLLKLLGMKCGYGQGYYLSLPLSCDDAEKYLDLFFTSKQNDDYVNPLLHLMRT